MSRFDPPGARMTAAVFSLEYRQAGDVLAIGPIVDTFNCAPLPSPPIELKVYLAVEDIPGDKILLEAQFLAPDGRDVYTTTMLFKDVVNGMAHGVIEFHGVVFTIAGAYSLQVSENGVVLMRKRFSVILHSNRPA
jgi:hypothetical protein